jgi:ABC-2 type transport system permease protein
MAPVLGEPRDIRWTPFFALFRREISRFMKVIIQTVITPFVSSALYLMIFGVSLGKSIVLKDQLPYLSFLIPGLVMMSCLNNSFQNTSSSIVTSKFSGDLEDLKVAPFSHSQIVLALSLAAVIRGLLVGGVTFLVGEASYYFMYSTALEVHHPVLLCLFLLLGCLSFANFGIMVAFWARTFDQLSAVSGFVLLPLIYLGGVFFSVENLPPLWKAVSLVNPLLYMINGVRFSILGTSDVQPEIAIAVSVVAFLLTQVLAVRALKKGSFQRW